MRFEFRFGPVSLDEAVGKLLAHNVAGSDGRPALRKGRPLTADEVIPFAVPAPVVAAAEGIAAAGEPLLRVDPLGPREVSLVLSGSASARERLTRDFEPPLRSRVEALGASLRAVAFVALEDEGGEAALAEALLEQVGQGAGMILLAGETAIVDRHDIAPRAIERAGGEVVAFGAPVDPGNLLLLAGDRLGRADIAALGHGGLLEDSPERGMPRA